MENKTNWEIPNYKIEQLTPKKNKYCVCVFVINEGQKIIKQIERMTILTQQVDIIIADGGSTDGSLQLKHLKNYQVTALLTKNDKGKLGTQMRMAFHWALQQGYEGIVVIDGNGKDGIEDIPAFVEKMKQGYDFVQGSRFIPGGYHENTPLSRLVGLKLVHVPAIRLASGFKYTDTTNGFRAYSSKFLSHTDVAVFRSIFDGYELHYYLAIRAATLGFKVCEIPVSRVYPSDGKVPTKISPISGNLNVLQKLLSACFGRYNPER